MREAAQRRGVTSHRIRKLIKAGILPAEQVVRGAPFQIRAADLDAPSVVEAAGRKGRPCHIATDESTSNVSRYLKRRCTMNRASQKV